MKSKTDKKKRIIGIFLLLPMITQSFAFAQDSKSHNRSTGAFEKKIEELIRPLSESNNYSGSVLIQNKGEVIFSKHYGLSDREKKSKINSQTSFFLASLSSMFTTAATMKLVDQGKLSLDDKLSKFLPDFPNSDKMTIHFLLTERSGIPRIGSQGKVNYSELTESAQTIDGLIAHLKVLSLTSEPGTRYEHSRSSYILLAKVIEIVSKKTFGDYLKHEIFMPLGMKNSGHFAYESKIEDIPNLATGYVQAGVTDLALAQQIHWSSKTGHASIYSTAEDLQKFANAAMNNKLLSADSWKRMQSPHHGDNIGYGFFTSPHGEHRRFYMSGGAPGFSGFFVVYPEDELVIVMLSNIQIFVPFFTVPALASLVFGEPYKKLDLITPPDIDEDLAKKYSGAFQFNADFYRPNGTVTITSDGTRLFADGGPLIPINEGDGVIKRFIHRRYWSTLEFVRGPDGKIVELKFDSFTGSKTNK